MTSEGFDLPVEPAHTLSDFALGLLGALLLPVLFLGLEFSGKMIAVVRTLFFPFLALGAALCAVGVLIQRSQRSGRRRTRWQ